MNMYSFANSSAQNWAFIRELWVMIYRYEQKFNLSMSTTGQWGAGIRKEKMDAVEAFSKLH